MTPAGTARRIAAVLDALLERATSAARWLALPLSALLFLQWPLRDLVQAYSREANDAAQVCFALYVAIAITDATRRGSHLAMDAFAARIAPRWRARIAKAAVALVLLPWSVLLIATGAAPAWQALRLLEGFPETLNPGYFLVRGAGFVLAALVLLQAIRDLLARDDAPAAD